MSITSHVAELQKKHSKLSEEIEMAERQPAHDPLEVRAKKREKLRLKEQIQQLQA